MKSLGHALLAAFGLALTCPAASVTIDGAGLRELRGGVSGTAAPAGSKVLLGYFLGLTDDQIVSRQADTEFLESRFIPFGSGGAVGQGTGGAAGYFTFVTSANVEMPTRDFTMPTAPNTDRMYVWAFDSSGSAQQATFQTIFTSSSPEWRFPVTDDGTSDRTISTDDSFSMLVGRSTSDAVYLAHIPEPRSLTAIVLAGAWLLGRRQSRKR